MISPVSASRLVHRFHRCEVAIAPAHERLAVDVLVVLGEIKATAERLVHDAPVVARGEAELGFGGGAEQRPAVLVEIFTLHDDAVRWSLEGVDVMQRDAHVLEPERAQCLETKDVSDDRRGEVRDRPFLEEVERVRDERDVLTGRTRHGIDLVRLGLVVLMRGEPVGPHHRPCRRRRLARNRRGGLLGGHAVLRRDPKRAQDVGVLGHVIRFPVAHLGVRDDA